MKKLLIPLVLFASGLVIGFVVLSVPGLATKIFTPQYGVFILRSGDVYVGKIDRLSRFRLTDPWYFRVSQGSTSTSQFLVSWEKGTIWNPVPYVMLNASDVMIWSYLKSDSQLVKGINDATAQGRGVIQVQ